MVNLRHFLAKNGKFSILLISLKIETFKKIKNIFSVYAFKKI